MSTTKALLIFACIILFAGLFIASVINGAIEGDSISFIILYFGSWAVLPWIVEKIGPGVEKGYLFLYRFLFHHNSH